MHLSPSPAPTGRSVPAHLAWNLHLLLGWHRSLPPLPGHGWRHPQKVCGIGGLALGPWEAGQLLRWGLRLGRPRSVYRGSQEASLELQPGMAGRRFQGMSQVTVVVSSLLLYRLAPQQPLLSLDRGSDCLFPHTTPCRPLHPGQNWEGSRAGEPRVGPGPRLGL